MQKKKKIKRAPKMAVQEEVTPNLIPMIDIMFLLLLFLMLGADMGRREFEEVILPIVDAGSVKPDKEAVKEGITIVNVYHRYDGECQPYKSGGICTQRDHWAIGVRGHDYTPTSIAALIKTEADLNRDPNSKLSERKVQIRADQAALYEYVQKVIEACALAGLYKIEIGAAAKV